MGLLEIDNLRSGYGKLPVLHGVSLQVAQNDIIALVGPNGAGKSTLLKTIMGLLSPSTGTVTFDGRDLKGCSPGERARRGIGFVPQTGNTFPDLTVEENMLVSLSAGGQSRSSNALHEVMALFPVLEERRRQRARTLSGGERQMLALAGAMVTFPRFIALDEPTTGLAPTIVQSLVDKILEINSRGTSILWVVEENPLEILQSVERVYLLRAGVVEREMEAVDLLSDSSLDSLFFGVDEPDASMQHRRVEQSSTEESSNK
jgi:branched-chain amino acid transport system ATP-binding protein